MRCFREIGQFEVDGEGFGDAVSLVHGEARDNFPRPVEERVFEIQMGRIPVPGFWTKSRRPRAWLLAMLNENVPQLLNHAEEGVAALLDQHAAQQCAERTNIAAEGKILGGVDGAGSQLSEPAALFVNA